MKISEARKIVGKMVQWSMLAQGIELDNVPEKITEDLPTLLKANRILEKYNERSKKRFVKIVAEKGIRKGRLIILLTLEDRQIAALYVAANFSGDAVLAMHNKNIVICLKEQNLKDKE